MFNKFCLLLIICDILCSGTQPLAVDHILGEVGVSECVQRAGGGSTLVWRLSATMSMGCGALAQFWGLLKMPEVALGSRRPSPYHPPRALRILQLPGLLLLGGIPAEGRARETMGARLDRQMGLRPPPTYISRRWYQLQLLFWECSGILCSPAKAKSLAVRHEIGETATSGFDSSDDGNPLEAETPKR